MLFLSSLMVLMGFSSVPSLVFEETARLDSEVDERFAWQGLGVGLTVDGVGNRFVCVPTENCIYWIDGAGKLVRTIGQEGQAPGEFQQLRAFQKFEDGTAVAVDIYLSTIFLHFFDQEMGFLERKTLSLEGREHFGVPCFSADGRLMALATADKGIQRLEIYSRDGQLLETLGNGSFTKATRGKAKIFGTREWYVLSAMNSFLSAKQLPLGQVAFGGSDRVYIAAGGGYSLTARDGNLNTLYSVAREVKPSLITRAHLPLLMEEVLAGKQGDYRKSFTESVLEEAWDRMRREVALEPVRALVPLGDQGLLVVTHFDPVSMTPTADHYHRDGRYLGSFGLPKTYVYSFGHQNRLPIKMVVREGMAHVLEPDEELEFCLVSYKIRAAGSSKVP